MSIRSFHIVFVTLATLFCAFLAGWAFWWPGVERTTGVTMIGAVGIVGVIVLPVYGVAFWRKVKQFGGPEGADETDDREDGA